MLHLEAKKKQRKTTENPEITTFKRTFDFLAIRLFQTPY